MTPAEATSQAKGKKRPPQRGPLKCILKELRVPLGLTLKDVALAVGTSASNLCRLEYGGQVELTTARKLSIYFGKSIDEIWPLT